MQGVLARPVRIALLVVTAGISSFYPVGAPVADASQPEQWSRWRTHDQNSTIVVDHSIWGRFLGAYVRTDTTGATRVDYGSVTAPDRVMVDAYITYLESVPVRALKRDEQLAYWINLYNAVTVGVVLRHYPVATIRDIDISPGWFSNGPWAAKLTTVEGQKLSLDDIEQYILRPLWRDPRVHYATNCASVGCPNLAPEAYVATNIDTQLNDAARTFVNHPRGVLVTGKRVRVSSLFKWYRKDFGGTEASVLDHLRRYASDSLAKVLSGVTWINEYDYDWSLNDHRANF